MRIPVIRNIRSITMACSVCLTMLTPGQAATTGENDLWQALTGGKFDFRARYRFEHVNDDLPVRDAHASTLRTTLGYTSGDFFNFHGRVQFQDVRDVFVDDFNDATGRPNAKTRFAVVADPSDTDMTEGYVGFTGLPNSTVKIGRQIVTYRGAPFHRHIGSILWRQNWQTFDAATIENHFIPDTVVRYAYLWNVNRIFSEEAIGPRDNFESDSHLVNIKYNGLPFLKLEGYGYLLDFDNARAFSTDTYGLRGQGAWPLTDRSHAVYALEYAHQSDANKNPGNFDVDYVLGEAGVKFNVGNVIDTFLIKFSYERLEGNGTNAFNTILGTNHAFQGWADRFLITPADGIEDYYLTAVITAFGAKFVASYHDINSDNLDYDFGEEIDLMLTRTFNKRYTLGLKYAAYDADDNTALLARNAGGVTADVSKFWFWAAVSF